MTPADRLRQLNEIRRLRAALKRRNKQIESFMKLLALVANRDTRVVALAKRILNNPLPDEHTHPPGVVDAAKKIIEH